MTKDDIFDGRTLSDAAMLKFILDALLFGDTGELNMRLIDRFGSFGGVFDASEHELTGVGGITPRVASFFVFVKSAYRQSLVRSMHSATIDCEADAVIFMLAFFLGKREPCEYCVYLDKRYETLGVNPVRRDRVRDAVEGAIALDAKRALFVSYKPFAPVLTPRLSDLNDLPLAMRALSELGVETIDHLEYTPYKFFSMRRAVQGDDKSVSPAAVSRSKYGAANGFDTAVAEFISRLRDRISREIM